MTIIDYQLQCRPASEVGATNLPQTPLAISIPAKHTGWTIKSLQPDTLYQDLTLDNFKKERALTGGGFAMDYIALKLQWKPPAETYGELKGYQVSFRLVGPPELLTSSKSENDDSGKIGESPPTHAVRRNVTGTSYTSTQIDNIPPLKAYKQQEFGRVYHFEVAAYNNIDIGLPAHLNITTPENVPDPPTHIKADRINQRQIKVTWNLPLRSTYRAINDYHQRPIPVTGFRIYYAAHDNSVDPSSERILEVGAVTMATIDDVSPNESYIIKIQSRGTDKRFGNWSDPIIVSASRYGIDQRGGTYQLSRVVDLRCFGVKSADFSKPMESSLKITWLPLSDRRIIREYEIDISGVKTFINELNEPVRLTLRSRKLTVSPTKQPTFGRARNDFLSGEQDTLLVHTVDKLEPNAVFDVKVRPIYEAVSNRQIGEVEAMWEHTSCRTRMHPPVNITAPIPVAFNADTNEVIIRILRVSENLGPIRRYYLVISNHDRVGVLRAADQIDWHAELLRISPKGKEAETRVAAEFTQLAFESTQLEIQVGGRDEFNRQRRAVPRKRPLNIGRDLQEMPSDEPSQVSSEILLHDCSLSRGRWYKAMLLACIYPDVQYTIPLHRQSSNGYYSGNQISSKTFANSVDKGDEYEDGINPNYCSSSRWSVTFTPEENLIVNDANETPSIAGGAGTGPATGLTTRASPSFFTIILVTVIIALALVALICIAVQCFFRRRPKQQRNSIGAKLPKTDSSLKIPLMPPPHHKSHVTGIDPSDMHPIEMSSKNANSTHSPTIRASPTLRLSNTLENGSQHQTRPPNGTPLRQTPQSMLGQTLPGQSPISLNHLAVHVTNLKSFDNNGLYKEYEAIDSGSGFTWHHANMELNKPKNRYANVIAYDHSRVLLNQLPGVPCSDYINANFLDGYRRPNAYIATQGPLPETFGDFWRMIWEQNSRVIVMMTKLEERSRLKCDQYWPSRGTEIYQIYPENAPRNPSADYTALSVTLLESTDYAYYTIRTFNLQKMVPVAMANNANSQSRQGGCTNEMENLQPLSEPRQIKQFQFTAWPDCGAPEQPQPLLLFVRQVYQARQVFGQQQSQKVQENGIPGGRSSSNMSRLGPTVVHCSAGVGRTGAFIVIDSQLDRIRSEKTVDIFGTVSRMRTQRNFMVQTDQQYAFLYEVMVEAVQLTGSEISAHSLYNYVMKLRQTASTSMLSMYLGDQVPRGAMKPNFPQNITALELEFQRVSINLQTSSQYTSALLPENRNKNRLDSVLPYDNNRVVLSSIHGVEGADYINASFVDGYWHERAYIATQAPLASTTKDFWRMIWEHNSPIIVMLIQVVENCREQCFQYWPSERSQRYEQFLVEPMVEYNMPSFILREFRITDKQDGQSRTLRQFQFSDWPDNGVPISRSVETLIDLISQVHKTQAQFGQDGPITVHCSTGAGRTGVFIALSILLERMRCEGMVDLLLTTRLLRSQRSNMIEDESQYAFCYTALLEFLASF
ncbi:hypothetical protein Aperf_G00000000560 [Anoplocephala perfoliata]